MGFRDSWIDALPADNSLDALLMTMVKSQQELGDNSMPKGYIVRTWRQVQYEWLASLFLDTSTTDNIMKQAIVTLHTYTYTVWKLRNEILHKDKNKSKTALKRFACKRE